jgi:hypothetical protein
MKNPLLVVPFREDASGERGVQKGVFLRDVRATLQKAGVDATVYVVEQSADGRKFNRGALLNIGFQLGHLPNGSFPFSAVIFHDVDLIPDADLAPLYGVAPSPRRPIHIARAWDRYPSKSYFGGVVSWSPRGFTSINGFPNTYWGWGGEDDEMLRRCKRVMRDFRPDVPDSGRLYDLEKMTLDEKLDRLRATPRSKNSIKWELRDAHARTWMNDGLNGLEYSVRSSRATDDKTFEFVVDIAKSEPWIDEHSRALA